MCATAKLKGSSNAHRKRFQQTATLLLERNNKRRAFQTPQKQAGSKIKCPKEPKMTAAPQRPHKQMIGRNIRGVFKTISKN
jgi:hypothetical protein